MAPPNPGMAPANPGTAFRNSGMSFRNAIPRNPGMPTRNPGMSSRNIQTPIPEYPPPVPENLGKSRKISENLGHGLSHTHSADHQKQTCVLVKCRAVALLKGHNNTSLLSFSSTVSRKIPENRGRGLSRTHSAGHQTQSWILVKWRAVALLKGHNNTSLFSFSSTVHLRRPYSAEAKCYKPMASTWTRCAGCSRHFKGGAALSRHSCSASSGDGGGGGGSSSSSSSSSSEDEEVSESSAGTGDDEPQGNTMRPLTHSLQQPPPDIPGACCRTRSA